ncbi:unnamed protein product [Blepharisma stoltei]|uniref:Photosystem I assembly protein Ycf4 n=1 Tax=Blepharisma stoltei TaxID=1481888 RepID=A0AAU9JK28_9CILI|nr:unnamed protein product [Blepharisma stoltei]
MLEEKLRILNKYRKPKGPSYRKQLEEIELKLIKQKRVFKLRRYPFSVWILSFIFCLTSTFLLLNLHFNIEMFEGYTGSHWLQYTVIIVFYVLSGMAFILAKIEVAVFNKDEKRFDYNKYYLIFFRWKQFSCKITEIADVGLQKDGFVMDYSDTTYYRIIIYFGYEKPLKILETRDQSKAVRKLKEIRAFLDLDGKLQINDKSYIN